jgi:ubiquinone biosynthesis protein UbiJ
MPFEPLATGILETALNTLINDQPAYRRQLARLKGKVLQLYILELKQTLTFVFSHQVDVLAAYEGEPDCFISLSLAVLPEFRQQPEITRLIKEDKLDLKGDHQLAQQFAQLMSDCKPDLEEWLSRITGDVVAHILMQGARDTGCWLKQQAQRKQRHLAEALTEEWKIAPPPLEIAYFCDQVDELSKQVEQADNRLRQLADKILS